MDRHDLSEVTAEDVARVHLEDLKVQEQYGCRALTYWFDEQRSIAFCLVLAPNERAVAEMHKKAHGMVPNQVIEVEADIVNAFLGRIDNPGSQNDREPMVIRESANRTIMVIRIEDFRLLKIRMGKEKAFALRRRFEDFTGISVRECSGSEVGRQHNSIIYSFKSAADALIFIQNVTQQLNQTKQLTAGGLKIKAGVCSGYPVNKSPSFFGITMKLANRLCVAAPAGCTLASSEVSEQLRDAYPADFYFDKIIFLNPEKERFLNELMDIIESNWDNPDFNVVSFGRQLGLSKARFYRLITKICTCTPNGFIREFRLKKAMEAIGNQEGNVSEIAYRCGFSSPSYFSKCFLERFGILPSAFAGAVG